MTPLGVCDWVAGFPQAVGNWLVGGCWVERVFGDKDHKRNPRKDLTNAVGSSRLRTSPQRRGGRGPDPNNRPLITE